MSLSSTPAPVVIPPATAVETRAIVAELIAEVGDTDDLLLAQNAPQTWARFADKAQVAPRLQELYVKRAFLDKRLARAVSLVDTTGDQRAASLNQITLHLRGMKVEVQAEIELVEKRARAGRALAIAPIATTAPITPPLPVPTNPYIDGNDGAYRGDLYRRAGRVMR